MQVQAVEPVDAPEPTEDGVVRLRLLDRPRVVSSLPPDLALRMGRPVPDEPEPLGEIEIRLELHGDGSARPTGRALDIRLYLVEGAGAQVIRSLPWKRLIDAAAAYHTARTTNDPKDFRTAGAAAADVQPAQTRRGPGRPRRDVEHYRDIAERYEALVLTGQADPVRRLADQLGENRSTVASWVHRARNMGLLGPAPRSDKR